MDNISSKAYKLNGFGKRFTCLNICKHQLLPAITTSKKA